MWAGISLLKRFEKRLPQLVMVIVSILVVWSLYGRYYNYAAYYNKDIPQTYFPQDNANYMQIDKRIMQKITIDPGKTFTGIRFYIDKTSPSVRIPYQFILKDERCVDEIDRIFPDMTALKQGDFNDVLFKPIKNRSEQSLCFVIEPLKQADESSYLRVHTGEKSRSIVVVPLYLY